DARDGITAARLVDSPVHLAKLDLTCPLYRKNIFATLEYLYTSDRLTLEGQTDGGFGTANFTLLSRQLVKGLEISASVYNLFDTRYSDPGGPEHRQDVIQQDGRTYWIKAIWRF